MSKYIELQEKVKKNNKFYKKYRNRYKQITLYLSHEDAEKLEQLRLQTSISIGLELTINQLVRMMINNKSKIK